MLFRSTIAERVNVVTEMILDGMIRADMIQYASKILPETQKPRWDVSSRQIDTYISKANQQISKQYEKDIKHLTKSVFSKYKHIHRKLMNVKDYKGAIIALDRIVNLTGIEAPKKLEQNLTINKPLIIDWTDDDKNNSDSETKTSMENFKG